MYYKSKTNTTKDLVNILGDDIVAYKIGKAEISNRLVMVIACRIVYTFNSW